jgi:hypothetical protein
MTYSFEATTSSSTSLCDVTFWNKALDASVVTSLMFNHPQGNEPNLVAALPLAVDLLDETANKNNLTVSGTTPSFSTMPRIVFVSGGANNFTYCSFVQVGQLVKPAGAPSSVVLKKSVQVGSPKFLYALLSLPGDDIQAFPVGILSIFFHLFYPFDNNEARYSP